MTALLLPSYNNRSRREGNINHRCCSNIFPFALNVCENKIFKILIANAKSGLWSVVCFEKQFWG